MLSPLTRQLIDALKNLPGVGPKSAQRIAFQLLSKSGQAKGLTLASALQNALSQITHCLYCRMFTEQECCDLCRNPKREPGTICVVESPADAMAIEETHTFRGRYFVLMGVLSPLDGIGPQEIGLSLLFERLTTEAIQEVILATNATIEGKATAQYIANHLDSHKIKCTRIALGIPVGGELEYLDSGTLMHALTSRILMKESN